MKAHQIGYGDYLRFRELILRRSGLHFPDKKREDLEIGLLRAFQDAPETVSDLTAYYHYLTQSANLEAQQEMDRVINLLTVGETHFFRDSAQFDALANHVLPALIERKRAAAMALGANPHISPELRIWSAGCATGEEAYSLAILLTELISDIEQWRISILATDINHDSLTRAREALYSDWSFRESRALSLRERYFTPEGRRNRLDVSVRRMVTFSRMNLKESNFPSIDNGTTAMDLIMCRNVTIYFDAETTQNLVNRFYDVLVDKGWLVVGHSEPSLMTYRDYQAHTFPGTLLYQKLLQPSQKQYKQELIDNLLFSKPLSRAVVSRPLPSVAKAVDHASNHPPRTKGPTKPLPPRRTGFLIPPDFKPPRRTGILPLLEISNSQELSDDPYKAARKQLSLGHINQAIITLQGAMDDFSDSQRPYAYCLLARAYADQGRWEQARDWCQSAIDLNSLLPESYAILAMVNENEGMLDQAIINLKKVIYLDRDRPLTHFSLAMLYQKMNQMDKSRRVLRNVEKILASWPSDMVIPDSGGTSAKRLLESVRQLLNS